jgi:Recombination endonuclease VII
MSAYVHRMHPECAALKERKRRARNRWGVWEMNLRCSYGGMTPAEFHALLAIQGGLCGICRCDEATAWGRTPKRSKPRLDGTDSVFLTPWVVDHDHRTGRVRGLLCHRCNKRFTWDEDPAMRAASEAYVTDPPANRADIVRFGRRRYAA